MEKYDVFISYSRKDSEAVRKIEKALAGNGISYFIDRTDINLGEDFAEKIARCIYDSEIILFVWTKNSNQSENTANEIALAIDFQKTIIPFRIGQFKSDFKLAYRLVRFNRIEADTFSDDQINSMAAQIAAQLGRSQDADDNGEKKNKEGEEYQRLFNRNAAFQCFTEAVEQGSIDAMYNLGTCYENGWGVEADYDTALRWYRKAARHGSAIAVHDIGKMYQQGRGVPRDIEKAIEQYKEAAGMGYTQGYSSIGECYTRGIGIPADHEEALEWFLRGTEKGDALSMYYAATYYAEGDIIDIDMNKAAALFRRAALLGNGLAIQSLEFCYRNGQGVKKDDYTADMLHKAYRATVVLNYELAIKLVHEALV